MVEYDDDDYAVNSSSIRKQLRILIYACNHPLSSSRDHVSIISLRSDRSGMHWQYGMERRVGKSRERGRE